MDRRDFIGGLLGSPATTDNPHAATLDRLRKYHGDTAVLDAVAETGSIEEARRLLNREQQRAKRAYRAERRRSERANQVEFRSAVMLDQSIVDVLARGRQVRNSGNRRIIRATVQSAIQCGSVVHGNRNNNTVVLWDLRSGEPIAGGVASAEMVWTGADYRLHMWRRSASDPREAVTLSLHQSAPDYPIMPPISAPVPAWRDDVSDLVIERKTLAALED